MVYDAHMGDKSPKATQKQKSQKDAKSSAADKQKSAGGSRQGRAEANQEVSSIPAAWQPSFGGLPGWRWEGLLPSDPCPSSWRGGAWTLAAFTGAGFLAGVALATGADFATVFFTGAFAAVIRRSLGGGFGGSLGGGFSRSFGRRFRGGFGCRLGGSFRGRDLGLGRTGGQGRFDGLHRRGHFRDGLFGQTFWPPCRCLRAGRAYRVQNGHLSARRPRRRRPRRPDRPPRCRGSHPSPPPRWIWKQGHWWKRDETDFFFAIRDYCLSICSYRLTGCGRL